MAGYEYVVEAKEKVEEALNNVDEYDVEGLYNLLMSMYDCAHKRINKAAAVATVLVMGTVVEDRYTTFMMPATSDCCRCFKKVKKALSKGRQLHLYVVDGWSE